MGRLISLFPKYDNDEGERFVETAKAILMFLKVGKHIPNKIPNRVKSLFQWYYVAYKHKGMKCPENRSTSQFPAVISTIRVLCFRYNAKLCKRNRNFTMMTSKFRITSNIFINYIEASSFSARDACHFL